MRFRHRPYIPATQNIIDHSTAFGIESQSLRTCLQHYRCHAKSHTIPLRSIFLTSEMIFGPTRTRPLFVVSGETLLRQKFATFSTWLILAFEICIRNCPFLNFSHQHLQHVLVKGWYWWDKSRASTQGRQTWGGCYERPHPRASCKAWRLGETFLSSFLRSKSDGNRLRHTQLVEFWTVPCSTYGRS